MLNPKYLLNSVSCLLLSILAYLGYCNEENIFLDIISVKYYLIVPVKLCSIFYNLNK